MYPDFQYLFEQLFGTQMPAWLSIFKTFGFFVAIAFITAAWVTTLELKRKEQQGLLIPEFKTIEVGHPASANELILSAVIGFLLGFKIGGMFGNWAQIAPNPLGYMFSLHGNLLIGIVGALLFGYMKYAEKKKEQLPEPQTKRVAIYPHQRISEIVVVAAIGGLVGAKVFNALETWQDFLAHPAQNLLSSSGLTFYGGLIVSTAIFYYYSRKHKIPFKHLCDATAPALMLAYGLGRFGCHFAGDGDWGIFNSAYITGSNGVLHLATTKDYMMALHQSMTYFQVNFGSIANVPQAHVVAPHWLPRWLFAMNYPHNVNNEGMHLAGCTGNYCGVLPVAVFPTPLYEAITCIGLFFFLWYMRKKVKYPLHLFGIYLILNGIERFLVETIRVNYRYDLGFIHPTQAEIISTLLVLGGLGLLLFYKKPNSEIVSEKVKLDTE